MDYDTSAFSDLGNFPGYNGESWYGMIMNAVEENPLIEQVSDLGTLKSWKPGADFDRFVDIGDPCDDVTEAWARLAYMHISIWRSISWTTVEKHTDKSWLIYSQHYQIIVEHCYGKGK